MMSFSKGIVEDVLVACGRSCCICHKFCGVRIETHHIKPKQQGGTDHYDNCIPLCFDCHADVEHYNTQHPRGRKYSEEELRKHRDNWYTKVQELSNPLPLPDNVTPLIQNVKGNNNITAGNNVYLTPQKVTKKIIVQTDPDGKHISNSTARKIQDLVSDYIDLCIAAQEPAKRAATRIWGKLKKEFNVTSYKEIPIEKSEEAIRWLQGQLAMARPKIRRKNPTKWRDSFYKPIYARSNELGMSKKELYDLAEVRLDLKQPLTSLKELTQANLEKLHHIMIAKTRKQ